MGVGEVSSAHFSACCSAMAEFHIVPEGRMAHAHTSKKSIEVMSDGPLSLVVLVGDANGRWSAALSAPNAVCMRVRKMLDAAVGQRRVVDGSAIVGVAVIRSWHCVFHAASHAHTFELIEVAQALHPKRAGQRFIEHVVVAAAFVGFPIGSGSVGFTSGCQWSGSRFGIVVWSNGAQPR